MNTTSEAREVADDLGSGDTLIIMRAEHDLRDVLTVMSEQLRLDLDGDSYALAIRAAQAALQDLLSFAPPENRTLAEMRIARERGLLSSLGSVMHEQ